MSPARIKSIQIGCVISEGNPDSRDIVDRTWTTGFYKRPIAGSARVTTLGIVGDSVADTRLHGGPNKAILCYAAAHYAVWAVDHPQLNMGAGALGENLTIDGADENSVCIGDRYELGTCRVEVSQPRQPCWKIARRWGVKTLTKEVAQTGRTGWYVRVIQAGSITADQPLELTDRPNPTWSVARLNDIMFGREIDRMAVDELMGIAELSESWKSDIA